MRQGRDPKSHFFLLLTFGLNIGHEIVMEKPSPIAYIRAYACARPCAPRKLGTGLKLHHSGSRTCESATWHFSIWVTALWTSNLRNMPSKPHLLLTIKQLQSAILLTACDSRPWPRNPSKNAILAILGHGLENQQVSNFFKFSWFFPCQLGNNAYLCGQNHQPITHHVKTQYRTIFRG